MAITQLEFAERVKSKYPQYKNVDDTELVSLILDRYPEYKTRLGEKEYSKNLLTNTAKTLVSGGVQAAINAGAGVQQSYSMLLGDKSDTSEEAVEEYASQRRVQQRKGGSRMAKGKILAHRKRKNEVIQSLNENAHRLRNLANSTDERFNIDPEFANTLGGQVSKGFGQMVSNIGSVIVGTAIAGPVGGFAAAVGTIAPQMVSEAVSDSEATLGKSYMDMTEEEKDQVALATAGYATLGTAFEFAPVARLPWVKNFLRGKTKVAAGVLKSPSVRREIAKGFAAEGFTEAAQGQLLDSLARATFDDDRELMSWDVLRQRFNEFAVGGIVGGGTSGGIATIQKAAQGELFKPKETKEVQTDGTTKQVYDVSYTDQKTGQPATIEIDAESQEEAVRIVEGGLAQSAVEGTIVARPKPAPEPITEEPVAEEVIPEAEQAELQQELQEELQLTESDFAPDEEVSAKAAPVGVKQFDFTDQEAEAALPKKEKVKFNKHKTEPIQKGAVRLNLNSKFKKEGVAGPQFVQTLHPINKDGKPNYGKAHSYGRSFTLKNATFSVNPLARAVIGYKIKNKYPMASVDGEVVNTDGSLEGEVLSFNPFRENAFVDSQGRPVKSADEVTVYGTKAYARGNIQYADTTESVSKDELITLARRGEKYVHPKFHPQGVKVTLSPEQIKQIDSSPELPVIGTQPDVTAGAAAVGLTPKEFTSRLKDTKVVDDQGKPLKVYRGTRNIEFETEGRGRVPSFTSSPDVASTYSSTIGGGPFNIRLSFKEGASVSPVFLSMKKPLDFTAEDNLMSLGNYLAYMEYGNNKNGITKEEVDQLINYMVRRGRGKTKAKGDFVFRLDDSFTTPEYRPLDFSRDEYSDLVEFKDEYDSGLSLEDNIIQDGLYFDQFIAADAPVTKKVAERLGFDGIIHKDAFGLKEEYEQLTGKKVEGLTQEKREDGLSIIEDDIHITYRPFSEEQVIGSLQQPEVTAGAAAVEPEITSDEVLTDEQVQQGVESEHGATLEEDIDGDVFAGAAPVPAPSQQAAPIITRASLAGKKLFAYFSDRTRVGTYTGINPDSGISIALQGGPMYPFMGNNKEKKAGWAFSSEGMFTRFLNRVKKTDGIGLVTLYSKENLRANLTFLKAYVAEVKYAIEQGTLTEQRFLEVANNLRESAVQSKRKTGKSLDKPFESIEDFEKGLADSTFDVRAAAFFGYNKNKKGDNKGSKIGADALVDEGFPNISTMVDLFADPSLEGLESGTIVSAVQFDQNQDGPSTATTLGVDEHFSYKVVIKGEGLGFFSDPVLVSDVIPSRGRTRRNITRSAETSMADVEFQADEVAATSPIEGQGQPTASQAEASRIQKFIEDTFGEIAAKIGTSIRVNPNIATAARYIASDGVIEINPARIVELQSAGQVDIVGDAYITSVMREEIIHAAMSKVILKKSKGKKEGEAFQSFMESLGKSLTPQQRNAIQQVYQGLETDAQFGAEYSRAAIQQLLYGNVTESFITEGRAFDKIKSLLKSVQAYIAKTFKADVTTDPEAAAIIVESARLLQAVDPNAKPVEQKAINESMAYSKDVNPNAEVTSEQVAESGKPPSEKKLNVNFARKYLFTVSSLLNSIHPRLKKLIRNYYGAIQGEVLDYQKRVAPFFKKYRGIKNADDRKRLKQLLSYSPVEQEGVDPLIEERDALLRKYDLFNDYQLQIRPVLNELYNRLQDEGIMVGFLEQYFPRSIKDLDKVKNRAGKELRDAFREFIETRNERIEEARRNIEEGNPEPGDVALSKERTIQIGNPKTAALEAQQWDQFTRGFTGRGENRRRNLPGNFLSRTEELNVIPENLLDAYEDPGAAMERYIYNAVTAIQTTRLMGSKFANVPEGLKVPPASELGLLIQELRANGEISMEDADGTVPDIFAMILSPVQVENIYFQLARTFGYGTLLVEFTSTLSQLYDLPFVMLDNGIFGTAIAMFGPRLKGDDFGIDVNQVSVEFASDSRVLEKAVRLGLRATGFTKLDQVMKETNLTANYNRYRKLARGYFKDRNSANSKKFVAELTSMGYSAQEQTQLIADLQKGNRDSAYIRTLLFNKLSETQPLTKAEMALGIVGNPNLRFTVAMKSFMIKQLNFVKDRMINEFIDGVRTNNARKIKKASSDLALLMTFLLMIGLPVDALKDFLAGRLGYMSDYLFNGIFRIAGISRYTAYQARKEGVGQAAFDYLTPVAIQQFVDATSELDRVLRGERALTESKFVTLLPFSDVINRIFGFQKGRESKEYLRRVKEGERPFIVPPGAL